MDELNFYNVDADYVSFLKRAEAEKRGFSRVPNMEYSDKRKPKFICGVVLQVHGMDYYVPVTSFKEQKPENFLIKADSGHVVSSLRFNYMFPIPRALVAVRRIDTEPDLAYRALLAQELRFCIKNQAAIQYLAERTYRRVLIGKNPGLVKNSCDFALLEQKCTEYLLLQKQRAKLNLQQPEKEPAGSAVAPAKETIAQKLERIKAEQAAQRAGRTDGAEAARSHRPKTPDRER